MSLKPKLLAGVSAAAFAAAFGAAAQAQVAGGPSVLERILGQITTGVGGTTIDGGDVSSVYANIAATVLSTATGQVLNQAGGAVDVTNLILGNLDASVTVDFTAIGGNAQPLISRAATPVVNSAGAVVGNITAEVFQPMEGTLGDITTLTLGASLDASAAITLGAAQDVAEAIAGASSSVSQTTDLENVVAINGALNQASLDSSVTLTVQDYALAASAISTTAIGAVGGGTITAGNISRLNRTIFNLVGDTGN